MCFSNRAQDEARHEASRRERAPPTRSTMNRSLALVEQQRREILAQNAVDIAALKGEAVAYKS